MSPKPVPRGHPTDTTTKTFIGQPYQQFDNKNVTTVCVECSITDGSAQYAQYVGVAWCPFCDKFFSVGASNSTKGMAPGTFVRTMTNGIHWCEQMKKLDSQELCFHAEFSSTTTTSSKIDEN